jgi:hypothetical protein
MARAFAADNVSGGDRAEGKDLVLAKPPEPTKKLSARDFCGNNHLVDPIT